MANSLGLGGLVGVLGVQDILKAPNDKAGNNNSAAKDDVFSIASGVAGNWALDVLNNDPGSAALVSLPKSTFSFQGDASGTGNIYIENGQVKFDLGAFDADSLPAGKTVSFTFQYTAKIGNGVQSTANVNVTLTGANNKAEITSINSDVQVLEDGGVANGISGDATASGQLSVKDVDSGEAHFQTPAASALVGTYGNFAFNSATGEWTYTLDQAKADALKGGEKATDKLVVTSADGTASQAITVNITGSNDYATIAVASEDLNVVEAGGASNDIAGDHTASGQLTVADVDGEASFQAPAATALVGTYGTFAFNAATGAWSYEVDHGKTDSLNDGETVVETLTVKSADGSASHTISVNVTGSNDLASITTANDNIAVTEAGGSNNETAGVATASGTLQVLDVDAGEAQFADVNGADLAGTYGNFEFDATNGAWKYTLDQSKAQSLKIGDKATDKLTISSRDGTASETVTVDITGSNDAPTITSSAQSGAVAVDEEVTASGVVQATDVDGDVLTYSSISTSSYGTFGVDAVSGAWTFTLDSESEAVLALTDLDSIVEDFIVNADDGNGGIVSQTVQVTIAGPQDSADANLIIDNDDIYIVDEATDRPFELPDDGTDTVYSYLPDYKLGDNLEILYLAGSGKLNGKGNALDNIIYGNDARNSLTGGDGNDEIYAGAGDDFLNGGTGDDFLNGDIGTDTATYKVGGLSTGVTVDLSKSGPQNTGYGFDTLENIENIEGTMYNDVIFGDAGNNTLNGLNGSDILRGGSGNDYIVLADTHLDHIVFESVATNGLDTIRNFHSGNDRLVFYAGDGYDVNAKFTAGTSAVGGSAQFIWNASSRRLSYDTDGAGGVAQVDLAILIKDSTLVASDIEVQAGSIPTVEAISNSLLGLA